MGEAYGDEHNLKALVESHKYAVSICVDPRPAQAALGVLFLPISHMPRARRGYQLTEV